MYQDMISLAVILTATPPPRAALLAVYIYMDHWHLKLSVMSKQFSSLSLPTLVPSALGSLPLGGRVSVSGSLEPVYAYLLTCCIC